MKVSIVLPTFNRGYCVQRAIHSVFAQTYPDWELLIVDDGSTDDTQTVLARFTDPRIRVLRHSVNRGVAAARNTALAAARGEFIAFLDSDDEWKPEKLARQLDLMTRAPNAPVAFTDLVWRRGDVQAGSFARTLPVFSKLLQQHLPTGGHSIIPQRTMYLCLLEELPVKPSTLMIRAEIRGSVGQFDEQLRSGEDWEFLLRAARKFDFAYLDEPLTVLNVLPDATHFRYLVEDKENFIQLLRKVQSSDKGDREAQASARRGIAVQRKHLYWHYMERGCRLKAALCSVEGFRETLHWPFLARVAWAFQPSCLWHIKRRLFGPPRSCRIPDKRRPHAESPASSGNQSSSNSLC